MNLFGDESSPEEQAEISIRINFKHKLKEFLHEKSEDRFLPEDEILDEIAEKLFNYLKK